MDELLESYQKKLIAPYQRYEHLDELYRAYKNYVYEYFDGTKINDEYQNYANKLHALENSLPNEYIIDTTACFKDIHSINNAFVSKNRNVRKYDSEDILDYLVFQARRKITDNRIREHFDSIDLKGKCYEAASHVQNISMQCGVLSETIRIDTGYDYPFSFSKGFGYHYFNIISLRGKKYLVDTTYKQFFKKSKCSLEKLGVPYIMPPHPGAYMVMDKLGLMVAYSLLKYGWIELNDEILKKYLDGFTISYRNGLYYEDKDLEYKSDYTMSDYEKFIRTNENQVDIEGEKVLGYQYLPIKNPSKSFIK